MIRKKLHQWWASDPDGQWQAATHVLDMPLTPQAAAEQSSRNFLTRMCFKSGAAFGGGMRLATQVADQTMIVGDDRSSFGDQPKLLPRSSP